MRTCAGPSSHSVRRNRHWIEKNYAGFVTVNATANGTLFYWFEISVVYEIWKLINQTKKETTMKRIFYNEKKNQDYNKRYFSFLMKTKRLHFAWGAPRGQGLRVRAQGSGAKGQRSRGFRGRGTENQVGQGVMSFWILFLNIVLMRQRDTSSFCCEKQPKIT